MRKILKQQNLDLRRELELSKEWISNADITEEMCAYHKAVLGICDFLMDRVCRNLSDLDSNVEDVIDDVRSETQSVIMDFNLFNERLVGPIRRFLPSDRICLKLLGWLHNIHPQTKSCPLAINDGAFGVWPVNIPIYFMPSSRQQGLLLLPLFFHEFGHVLYRAHQDELDSLIKDFQNEIKDLLTPRSIRDDIWTEKETEKQNRIVEIWYNWMIEIFCDAVGFTIGGPSFLNAFSMYFRLRGSWEFHVPEGELWKSEHPISLLRMRLIAEHAKKAGCSKVARVIQEDWEKIAKVLGVKEDHYGFFDQEFYDPIRRTINDMLIEASPYKFSDEDVSDKEWDPSSSNPIHLLNKAWSIFFQDLENYPSWEQNAIRGLLNSKLSSLP